MIRCGSCGRQNPSGVEICHHCGTPLQDGGGARLPAGVPPTELEGGGFSAGKRKTQFEAGGAAGDAAKRRTEFESPPGSGAAAAAAGWGAPGPGGASYGGGASGGGGAAAGGGSKRKTVIAGEVFVAGPEPRSVAAGGSGGWGGAGWGAEAAGPDGGAGPARRPDNGRRLMGWLVTYDHNHDGLSFDVRMGPNALGRAEDADIQVWEDKRISNEHALIRCRPGRIQIFDERSANGTFVNDAEIYPNEPADLKDGDVVRCGDTTFIVKLVDPAQVAQLWPAE